ncbi:Hypothetical protein GOX0611 [Gluconobacter oxydans 621H]|uniref:Uncharacterized protein n=1 Tax=Gluconobacter oxydans (strain 621H) TaxID=290633 RepID=Q5FTA7_GLUOX|nr:Hypothetical protein GOX0611 [Gluconobacter oxydans 621H]
MRPERQPHRGAEPLPASRPSESWGTAVPGKGYDPWERGPSAGWAAGDW